MYNREKGESVMFKVFIKNSDSTFEQKQVFSNPFEAEKYFNELCKQRSDAPKAAVLTRENQERKCFRLDINCPDECRFETNEEILI